MSSHSDDAQWVWQLRKVHEINANSDAGSDAPTRRREDQEMAQHLELDARQRMKMLARGETQSSRTTSVETGVKPGLLEMLR